jgi:hypothetical protein
MRGYAGGEADQFCVLNEYALLWKWCSSILAMDDRLGEGRMRDENDTLAYLNRPDQFLRGRGS